LSYAPSFEASHSDALPDRPISEPTDSAL